MKWYRKKMTAWVLTVALTVMTVFPSYAMDYTEKCVTVEQHGLETSDKKEPDVSSPDVSSPDVSSPDVSNPDVSGSDGYVQNVSSGDLAAMKENFTQGFWVERYSQQYVGSYSTWQELLDGMNQITDKKTLYYIEVYGDAEIGKTLPEGLLKIFLKPQEGKDTLYFSEDSFTIPANTEISDAKLCVKKNNQPVNLLLKGGNLKTIMVSNIGAVTGTGKETWTAAGGATADGMIQKLEKLSVIGKLYARGGVKDVALWEANDQLFTYSGQKYLFQNVDVTSDVLGKLVLQMNAGKLPEVQISGNIEGVLKVSGCNYPEDVPLETDVMLEDVEFSRGQQILKATVATADRFVFSNEKTGYKIGEILYYGDPFLKLYEQDELLGQYYVWEDLVSEINRRKAPKAEYRVVFRDSFTWKGAWKMPAKGRCQSLYLDGAGYTQLEADSLTAVCNLRIGSSVVVKVKSLSAASYDLTMDSDARMIIQGNLTVKNLEMNGNTRLNVRGKATIKNQLVASEITMDGKSGYAPSIYLAKGKSLSVKNTRVGSMPVLLMVTDSEGNILNVPEGTTLLTTTGNTYASQFQYQRDPSWSVMTYRKGNTIRAKGDQDISYEVTLSNKGTEESWGLFESLTDIRNEVNRRKDKEAEVRIKVVADSFVKGNLPVPSAGRYQKLVFTGKQIFTTGNLQLTGDMVLYNNIVKVKKQGDTTGTPVAVNLSKYTLEIPEETKLGRLANITGTAKSFLKIDAGTGIIAEGAVKGTNLALYGQLTITGNMTVGNILYGPSNCLYFDLSKKNSITGTITGESGRLCLAPKQNGKLLEKYEEGLKVLTSAPRLNLADVEMLYRTDYVFYRDGSAVKLGKPVLYVYSGTTDYSTYRYMPTGEVTEFVLFKDAIEFANRSAQTEYVICATADINAEKSFVTPARGKNVILCSWKGETRILNLPKTTVISGGRLEIHDFTLKSANTVPSFTLKDGASLSLQDAAVNSISAPKNTRVTLAGQISFKGTLKGAADLSIQEGAVIRTTADLTAGSLVMEEDPEYTGVEFRLRKGKKLSVSGAITTTKNGQYLINIVNRSDVLENISEGTVLAVAPYGEAEQFKTENRKTDSLIYWGVEKNGKNIRTAGGNEGQGKWSDDFY